ncbi:hypothetical protein CHS0354_033305 [Potamilus streckersoni]|uniref:EGF-like domain-containing protein n=1 Tax=Potamilus streckersoni TaxID=2493646 RepID=A0AAE0RTC8_9BIVA|nr:hypothetical protein CHS0354_033305 [Potamilus streckersoni]
MMAGWHYMVSLVGVYVQVSGIFSQNCTTGSGSLNGQCLAVCSPGNYLNATNNVCFQCELGFYQDQNNATSCKSCGTERITLIRGSPSYLYCVVPCPVGRYHTDTVNTAACEECPVGQYQNASGQQSCLICPSGRTTYLTGSALCYDICNVGSFFNTTLVSCQYCPPGQYQPNTGKMECSSCPPGYVSTTGASQCQVFCSAGQHIDNRTSQCVPCEIGTYQPETSQTSCISCGSPENWVTNRTGSISISDCSFFCPSGYYKVGINSCESCPIGTYKDSAIDRFGTCQQCPPDSTTNGTRTTSIAFCNVYLCSPGTFWNLNQTRCQPCQRGTYQPNSGLTSCIPCESSKTTNSTGAIYVNQCIFICQRGYYHNSTTDKCYPCPVGFYQDVADQMFCKTCGFALTTLYQASTSINDCIEMCSSGTQYTSIGICEPCLRGTYRTAGIGIVVCQNCPNGFTTTGTGTTQISDCNIVTCYPGTYRTVNNTCEACPLGTYQPDFYQEFCSSCGPASNWLTEQVGSVRKDQCKFFCPSGYAVTSNNTCDMCPIGYYKDNTINVFGLCIQCPSNSLTASPGSTSINNCSLAECPAGYQRDNTLNGCQPCAIGFYQPSVNQNVCISCQPNYSTRSLASDSSSDCELYCPSGQNLQNESCISCQRGYYKDNAISPFMMCTRCPPNYVTPSTGSTSISNCYVRDCPAGTKRNQNDTGCIDCELGFYQPTPYETSCIQCQSGYSTSTTGSTSVTQCNRYCPPGTELINNTSQCSTCQIGFYKESVFSTVCNKCMDGFITENTGSTSVLSCNIVACEAGSYRDVTTNTCQLCPIGEYQDSKYQTSCKPCGAPASIFLWQTNRTGSTSLSECIYHCPSGYELRQDGKCYICPVGQYKDNIMNILSTCTVCPDGKVTPGEGAIAQSQCSIRDCPAGYFASKIVDRCIPCGFGEYQPRRNQTGCMICPTGTSTKQTGSTSISECFFYCQSGYESFPTNASTCQECERGYYKDNSMGIFTFCTRCPANFTTNRTAAVSSAECNIRICPLGFYINQINQCTLCPKGMYQDQLFRSSCIPCPPGQTTNSSGSFNVMDCYQVLCPSGEHYLNGVCQPCEIGYYKVGLNADRCQPCSNGIITLSKGSSSPTDCFIPACLAGQYLVEYSFVHECRPCPIGTYQDEIWQSYCKPCRSGYITIKTSSISLDACVAECLDGQVRSNDTGLCVPCPVGTYSTMGVNPKCVPCLNGLLTPAAGSITIADCSISPCEKGYRYIIQREQCEICPRGTYQPDDGKFICNYCPADRYYTSQEGATDVTECRSPCLIGQGFNQNTQQCFDCPVGTYQPIPFSFACIECPNGRKYTNSTGSIQESDCLSYCGSLSRNECSINTTCADDSSVPDGYTCVCKEFYTAKESLGSKPGRVCIHQCDTNFCMNNALCSKTDSGPVCSCSGWYKGERCQERLAAENVMDDKSRWIIPVVIAVVIFILIVIAFIVWFCFRDGFQPLKKSLGTSHYVESRAIVQDDHIYRTPAPRMLYAMPKITAMTYKPAGNIIFKDGTIKPEPELVYDNPRFQRLYENTGFQRLSRRSGEVSVYET